MSMGSGGNRAVPYINVTPLIDVLLVVIIIFMVEAGMQTSFARQLNSLGDHFRPLIVRKPHHRLHQILLDEVLMDAVDQ